jgi:hypothetical protein
LHDFRIYVFAFLKGLLRESLAFLHGLSISPNVFMQLLIFLKEDTIQGESLASIGCCSDTSGDLGIQ